MTTRVFLLAQGEQSRMEQLLSHPKHFLEVDGELLIVRTARMIIELGGEPVIVAPNTDGWRKAAADAKAQLYTQPHAGLCQLDIIRNLKDLWLNLGDDIAFLHGDTVFSRAALSHMVRLSPLTDCNFLIRGATNAHTGVGRNELYGFAMTESVAHRLLVDVLRNPKVTPYSEIRIFWDLLHYLQERQQDVCVDVIALGADDYTDDVDYPEDVAAVGLIEESVKRQTQIQRWRDAT